MFSQWRLLLRTGLTLKLNQIQRAFESYASDRTAQGKDVVASYAVGAGLYAAAGIFLIAACLVGLTALFRWLELTYGEFTAFGAIAGLLLVMTALCAAIGASRLNRPAKTFPGLGTRLVAAIKANPVTSNPVRPNPVTSRPITPNPVRPVTPRRVARRPADAAKAAAASVLAAPPRPPTRGEPARGGIGRRPARQPRGAPTGLLVAAVLAGLVIARHTGLSKADA